MFEGSDFPKSLDEDVFNRWLEAGRLNKIGYNYLLVVWDAYEALYRPVYVHHRDQISEYQIYRRSVSRESLVAAYDLYSESKIA